MLLDRIGGFVWSTYSILPIQPGSINFTRGTVKPSFIVMIQSLGAVKLSPLRPVRSSYISEVSYKIVGAIWPREEASISSNIRETLKVDFRTTRLRYGISILGRPLITWKGPRKCVACPACFDTDSWMHDE